MGYGAYSYDAHQALTATRSAQPTERIFAQRQCHPLMNPRGVRARESRDSVDHPESLAIAFALDVTGSMGAIPEALARKELPELVRHLQAVGVRDPQVLFMAVGDAAGDRAPLQVGQFESSAALMDQWLTWSWLEGGGGGGEHESYELALYFAAEHVEMDCYRKRGTRGYLFLTGDEKPYPLLSRHVVQEVTGDVLDLDVPVRAVVERLQRSFEPFFLIPGLARRSRAERAWRDLLGERVIVLEEPGDVALAAALLVGLNERLLSLDGAALFARLGDGAKVGRMMRALGPFAASIERDGAPPPRLDHDARLPEEDAPPGP